MRAGVSRVPEGSLAGNKEEVGYVELWSRACPSKALIHRLLQGAAPSCTTAPPARALRCTVGPESAVSQVLAPLSTPVSPA